MPLNSADLAPGTPWATPPAKPATCPVSNSTLTQQRWAGHTAFAQIVMARKAADRCGGRDYYGLTRPARRGQSALAIRGQYRIVGVQGLPIPQFTGDLLVLLVQALTVVAVAAVPVAS